MLYNRYIACDITRSYQCHNNFVSGFISMSYVVRCVPFLLSGSQLDIRCPALLYYEAKIEIQV